MLDSARLAATAVELGIAHYSRRNSWSTGSVILVAVASVSASAGGCFATAALLIYLIPILGAAGAALAVAGSLMAVAGAAALVHHYLARRSHLRAPAQPDFQALAAGAETFIRDNKALVLAGAFVAGLLIADERPRSRACPD